MKAVVRSPLSPFSFLTEMVLLCLCAAGQGREISTPGAVHGANADGTVGNPTEVCITGVPGWTMEKDSSVHAAHSEGDKIMKVDGVPELGWGKGKNCTFIGALEAALAVTDHPAKYSDLMGWSGMAFRVRWYVGNDNSGACPSAAVGEFEDETAAVQKYSGWSAFADFDPTPSALLRFKDKITASIDKGMPVLLYDPGWDVAVAYGYEKGGDRLFLRSYTDNFSQIDLASSPALIYINEKYAEPPSRRDAFIDALNLAVSNWHREAMVREKGQYLYGELGFDKWMQDYTNFKSLSEEAQKTTAHASRFCYMTLLDCRAAAATFLDEHSDAVNEEARICLKRAADICRRQLPDEIAMGTPNGVPEHLLKAKEEFSEVIAEIGKALAAERH